MRAAATLFLPVCLSVLATSTTRIRAEDTYAPAESAPPRSVPGAPRPDVTRIGDVHTTALNKPCLGYTATSQGLLSNKEIFSYVIAVTNKCGRSIKTQVCQKDRSGCNSTSVPAYASRDLVMGFGPKTTFFEYAAKESP